MSAIKPKLCAVCWEVCDRSNGQWIHTAELFGKTDHLCIPVDYDDERVQNHCDFCHVLVSKTELHALPCRDFKIPVLNARSMGAWACCAECAEKIDAGNWKALAVRAEEASAIGQMQNPEQKAAGLEWLKTLYIELQKNMTGPTRKWQPGDEEVSA